MEKIKIGIIGLGRLGRKHAENIYYRIPNAGLVAVCSTVEEELDAVRKEMDLKYVTKDYKELINIKELDGIVIASNSAFHCEMICEAAKAGVKNIFCEKPLGMSIEEINLIKDVLEKHEVEIFQIGFNRRFDKSITEMKKKIDDGYIGKPILIKMVNRDPKATEDFIVKFSPTSGGLVFDMLTHDYDLARWIIGAEAETVYGMGGVYAFEGLKEVGDIDNCIIALSFENGVMGFMETSRNSTYGYHVEIEVYGTDGCLRMGFVPNRDRLISLNGDGANIECVEWFYDFWEPTFEAELKHFVDCIQNNTKPLVGLMDGYKAVQWAFAARDAVAKRSIINLK